MKILAFSDWRIQSIEKLVEYLKRMNEKPDLIVYAGDDIGRFNKIPKERIPKHLRKLYLNTSISKNYFEEIARFSKYGLFAVAGNDDLPFVRYAINGKNVYNVYEKPRIVSNYVFIGLEGATKPPGILLYSEEQVWDYLNRFADKIPQDKKIIIISHTPPYKLLDIGIRFGVGHIGSTSLRKFIDTYSKRVRIVICGHAHSQGGKSITYKKTHIINCASHDNKGEPGRIAIININEDNEIKVKWDYIYDKDVPQGGLELMSVPLVGPSRAKVLLDAGINNAEQLAELSPNHELAKHPYFRGSFELIINYAKAITRNKPVVIDKHPFFKNIEEKNIYFFDAEYNPAGTKEGPFGIFLLGLMDNRGKVQQKFLNNPENEKNMLEEFLEWLINEGPILITYSSTSADKPQLINSFRRFGLSTEVLDKVFFDLYYDCINTGRKRDQYIFLPMPRSMSIKDISQYFGYKEPNLEIQNGLDALVKYNEFLNANNEKIKEKIKGELLSYNRADLERTKFIFEKIKRIMDAYE